MNYAAFRISDGPSGATRTRSPLTRLQEFKASSMVEA